MNEKELNSIISATQLLCRLGSSLRAQCESFKRKTLDKGKFVTLEERQKAIEKLLSICDTTKITLDKVEHELNATYDALESLSTVSPEKKYYSFVYGSWKLRISQKINLKDYTDAKVVMETLSKKTVKRYFKDTNKIKSSSLMPTASQAPAQDPFDKTFKSSKRVSAESSSSMSSLKLEFDSSSREDYPPLPPQPPRSIRDRIVFEDDIEY